MEISMSRCQSLHPRLWSVHTCLNIALVRITELALSCLIFKVALDCLIESFSLNISLWSVVALKLRICWSDFPIQKKYRHNLILWLGDSVTNCILWLFSQFPFPNAPFYTVVLSDSMTGVIGFYDYFPSDFRWKSHIFVLQLLLFEAISADYVGHAV